MLLVFKHIDVDIDEKEILKIMEDSHNNSDLGVEFDKSENVKLIEYDDDLDIKYYILENVSYGYYIIYNKYRTIRLNFSNSSFCEHCILDSFKSEFILDCMYLHDKVQDHMNSKDHRKCVV